MCGRYAASADQELLTEVFEIDEVAGPMPPPRFNIAPTDPVAAIVARAPKAEPEDVRRKLVTLRWGLVPSWSSDPKGAARLINARAETVAVKPAFRKAFAARRCLIPADGYYEWYQMQASGPRGRPLRQLFFIRPADGSLYAMAGLYEFWRVPGGKGEDAWLSTCSIITTTAVDAIGHIHDRMPMTVAPKLWSDWLDPGLTDPDEAAALMAAPQPDALEAYAVPTLVNKVGNDGPALIQPLPLEPSGQQ